MGRVLGKKRIIFIAVLLGSIAALFYFYQEVLVPKKMESDAKLQAVQSDVRQKYADVAQMKEEFILLQSQLKKYKELELSGFFSNQDRSRAIEDLEKLSRYAGLLKAGLKFDSGKAVSNPLAVTANQVVLMSPVEVDIEALDDVDVYSFIKFIDEEFEGRVDITFFDIGRVIEFSPELLRQIGGGEPVPVIKSHLRFNWYTMAPKDVVIPIGVGQ